MNNQKNNMTIVVQIPHQYPPIVWFADSDKDIIDIAYSKYGLIYERWSFAKAIDCWSEEEIPERLAELLKDHDEVMEIGNLSDEIEYCIERDAETEMEAAKEAIAHDFSSCEFLTVDEAKEFADSYRGLKGVAARIAVKKVLADLEEYDYI